MKDINQPTTSVSGLTPGQMLKAEREKQGLSVADVSTRLCLSAPFVEDIERDDYSRLSARVYARGHVKSYAHLLGIPESKIMEVLENVSMSFTRAKDTVSIDNERSAPIYQAIESSQQRSGLLLWGTIVALVIVMGLVMMWWRGPSAPPGRTSSHGASSAIPSNVQTSSASQSSAPISLPLSPQPPQSVAASGPQQQIQPQKVLPPGSDNSVSQSGEFRESNPADLSAADLPLPQASTQR